MAVVIVSAPAAAGRVVAEVTAVGHAQRAGIEVAGELSFGRAYLVVT